MELFIQGSKFKQLAEEHHKTNNGYALEYAHTHYASELLDDIRNDPDKQYVIITHNSDGKIKTYPGEHDVDPTHMPPNVVAWFGQNVCYEDAKVESIPIGLENGYCFPDIDKIGKIKSRVDELESPPPTQLEFFDEWLKVVERNNRNKLCYLNHNPNTNLKERAALYILFDRYDWVTRKKLPNGTDYDAYLHDLATHKFVFCPQGNGTDTHRIWEALYLGCIPIVKPHTNIKFYTGGYENSCKLPILVVEEWEDVTKDYLEEIDMRYRKMHFTWEALNFNYWKERILNVK